MLRQTAPTRKRVDRGRLLSSPVPVKNERDTTTRLPPVQTPVELGPYLSDLWRRRRFALAAPAAEFRASTAGSVLGNAWHLLSPLLLVGIYYVIFGVVLDVDRGTKNFVLFLAVGVFVFQFLSRSCVRGASAIRTNSGLMRALYFPRALVVLSTTVEAALLLSPALVLLLVLGGIADPSALVLAPLLIPVLAQCLLLAFALGLLCANLGHKSRDFVFVLPFALRVLFYASGTLFDLRGFASERVWQLLLIANPFAGTIQMFRAVLLNDAMPLVAVIATVTWTAALLAAGLVMFTRDEHSYGY